MTRNYGFNGSNDTLGSYGKIDHFLSEIVRRGRFFVVFLVAAMVVGQCFIIHRRLEAQKSVEPAVRGQPIAWYGNDIVSEDPEDFSMAYDGENVMFSTSPAMYQIKYQASE